MHGLALVHGARADAVACTTSTRARDIWSLGAILYELLDRAHAVHGRHDGPALRQGPPRQAHAARDELRPDLPEALEAVILRCLERDRANRFPDVAALVAALTPFAPSDSDASLRLSSISSRSLFPLGANEGAVTVAERGAILSPEAQKSPSTIVPRPAATTEAKADVAHEQLPWARGATISGWNATPAAPSKGKLRTRIVVASFTLAVAAGVALALHMGDHPSAPVAALQAPAAAPPAPDQGGGPAPTASVAADTVVAVTQTHPVHPAGDAEQAPGPAGGATAAARAPVKKTSRPSPPADAAGAGSDPFGGKRK